MKIKRSILLLLSLFALSNLYSQETVNIRIGGEEYEQEMPSDLQSAQELIRSMADMINETDNHIQSIIQQDKNERDQYIKQIEELTIKLKEVEDKSSKSVEKIVYVDKEINSLLKMNTRCTPFLVMGPVLGSDLNIGMHIEVGSMFRLFKNLQIGGSAFSSIYQETSRNFDIGVGLILAYSIY